MRKVTASLNYTGRRRITRESVSIRAVSQNQSGELILERLDVEEFSFPPEACVVLECGSTRTGVIRYELGPIGSLVLPAKVEYPLNRFDGLSILLKVVDTSSTRAGLILGMCTGLRTETSSSSGSLLPLVSMDLGEALWRLYFDETSGPELQVNQRINESYNLHLDPDFRATVLPEVVGQIGKWVYKNKDLPQESDLGEIVAEWSLLLRTWGFDVAKIDKDPDEMQDEFHDLCGRFAGLLGYATQYIESHRGDHE